MKSKMLPAITATVLMLPIAGYGSSLAATTTLPAATACSARCAKLWKIPV